MINVIDNTLEERGKRYGEFVGHATVTMDLKTVIHQALITRNKALACDQMEALHMICHKIGRIINGDENYDDSWVDIAGYAKLVADRLQKEQSSSIDLSQGIAGLSEEAKAELAESISQNNPLFQRLQEEYLNKAREEYNKLGEERELS